MTLAYAGIGTRECTSKEKQTITEIAGKLSDLHYVCYSGNASGSDQTFQLGSHGQCVIYLPFKGFESANYDAKWSLASYICGDTPEGMESVKRYHPAGNRLSGAAVAFHCRNHHQIMGYNCWPRVKFVVCCATPHPLDGVLGGTGQAVRIAEDKGIPVVNIRNHNWEEELCEVIRGVKNSTRRHYGR